jgi:hypothetical protein
VTTTTGGGGGGKPISTSCTSTAFGSCDTTMQPVIIMTAKKQMIYRRHFRPLIIHCSLLQKTLFKSTFNALMNRIGKRSLPHHAIQILFYLSIIKGTL